MSLRIRRGTEAERAAMSAGDPAQGELLHITDTDEIYVGDGSTAGGVLVGNVSHTIASHSDTTATGAELETLTDGSNADSLHVHTDAGGDVVGPASAVDSAIPLFDTTSGKLLKNSSTSIGDVVNRANHTGTQAASTISDFDTEVGNNSAVAANTAKVTNATHTGDVTGDAALTIAAGAVDIAHHSATGTPGATNYLRGDGTWATPSGTGAVTYTKIVYIEDPVATDSFPMMAVPEACTITRISHITDVGTVTWNLEERVEATPATAGTDVYAADEVSSTTNSVDTSFANAGLADQTWLHYAASAVASSPTKLWIAVTFEVA